MSVKHSKTKRTQMKIIKIERKRILADIKEILSNDRIKHALRDSLSIDSIGMMGMDKKTCKEVEVFHGIFRHL